MNSLAFGTFQCRSGGLRLYLQARSWNLLLWEAGSPEGHSSSATGHRRTRQQFRGGLTLDSEGMVHKAKTNEP